MKANDYEVLGRLGKGSYGVVYKVRHKGMISVILVSNDVLVMKQINIDQMEPLQKQEVLNEAKILQSLDSPYIVGYHDSFIEDEKLCIVMEYCEKGDLGQLLKARNKHYIEENVILKYFIEVCLALYYLHGKKTLHRDVKTMNMFLTKDFHIKLGDLGVAKVLNQTSSFAHTIVGTPYYLSPEVCQELPYTYKSDIWALGCALYEMCALKHPFEAKNQIALVMKIVKSTYDPLPAIYSKELNEIVSKCLQKNYKKRPSVNDILALPFIQQKAKIIKVEVPERSALLGRAEVKITDIPRKDAKNILLNEMNSKTHSESPAHKKSNKVQLNVQKKPIKSESQIEVKKTDNKVQVIDKEAPRVVKQMITTPNFAQVKKTPVMKKSHYAASIIDQGRKKPPRVRNGAPIGLARKAREVARPLPKKPPSKKLIVNNANNVKEETKLEDPDLFMRNIMGEDYTSIMNSNASHSMTEHSIGSIFREMIPSEEEKTLLASVDYKIEDVTIERSATEELYNDDFELSESDEEKANSSDEVDNNELNQLSEEKEFHAVEDIGKSLNYDLEEKYKEKLEVFEMHKTEVLETIDPSSIEKALKLIKDNKEMVVLHLLNRMMKRKISFRNY